MFVDLAVTVFPVVELALTDPNPTDQPLRGQFGPFFPVANVVDDLIAAGTMRSMVDGEPNFLLEFPKFFF